MPEFVNIKDSKSSFNPMKVIIPIIIIIAVVILLVSSTCVVEPGHTGVIVNLGKVSSTVYQEGFHFKIPFVSEVVQIDNRVLRTDIDSVSASKDLQNVSSTISVNYRVAKNSSADIYKNVGLDFDNIIVKPAVQECVKSVTAKFTAEELITDRTVVSAQMEEAISQKINSYGLTIEVFNIINFEFSEEFNKAIEAKQTAQQEALKAEQDLARIKVEAEQKITQAEAEAEAYRLTNAEITDKVLMMEFINKWDGKLPAVASDTSNIFDVSKYINGDFSESDSSDGQ